MKKKVLIAAVGMAAMVTSGCVVRTYEYTQKRVDQDLSMGNRGFFQGEAPPAVERKPTRTTRVVEWEFGKESRLELRPPMRAEDTAGSSRTSYTSTSDIGTDVTTKDSGNRGVIYSSDKPERGVVFAEEVGFDPLAGTVVRLDMKEYTVAKGDTLQKISQKFFGTTRKWPQIYDANQDILATPNDLKVGETIMIPMKEYGGAGKK